MTINDLFKQDFEGKNILIIGCPASGKTYLANQFKTYHQKIHTDDFIEYGYEQSMYKVLEAVTSSETNTIVEGIQGYRLLRKGAQLGTYYPDVVIELVISHEQMIKIYETERDASKTKHLTGMLKSNAKVLADYLSIIDEERKPIWYKILNEH